MRGELADIRAGREVPQEAGERRASKEDRRGQGSHRRGRAPGQAATETEDTYLCTGGGTAEAAGLGAGEGGRAVKG